MDLEKVNIVMVREDLLNIADWQLSDEFYFRDYRSGDMHTWFDVESQADDRNTFTEKLFLSTFNNRPELLEKRMIFVCDRNSTPIATSTAWYETEQIGLVHWVAVVPQMQGKGIAKPLLSATLKRLAQLGHESAMLRTQIFRIAAINLYLKAGFKPVINSQQDIDCWSAVRANPNLREHLELAV